MQWPIAENNPHNPRNIFAKRVCKSDKHFRNYKGKCHSVSKVLTATLDHYHYNDIKFIFADYLP